MALEAIRFSHKFMTRPANGTRGEKGTTEDGQQKGQLLNGFRTIAAPACPKFSDSPGYSTSSMLWRIFQTIPVFLVIAVAVTARPLRFQACRLDLTMMTSCRQGSFLQKEESTARVG